MAAAQTSAILIVEDEPDARTALAELLEAKGYTIASASNGLAALNHLRTTKPSLILLDMRMPIMDGHTFLQQARIRHLLEDVPVIVTTAEQTQSAPGADVVLNKPIRLDRLMPLIERFFDSRNSS